MADALKNWKRDLKNVQYDEIETQIRDATCNTIDQPSADLIAKIGVGMCDRARYRLAWFMLWRRATDEKVPKHVSKALSLIDVLLRVNPPSSQVQAWLIQSLKEMEVAQYLAKLRRGEGCGSLTVVSELAKTIGNFVAEFKESELSLNVEGPSDTPRRSPSVNPQSPSSHHNNNAGTSTYSPYGPASPTSAIRALASPAMAYSAAVTMGSHPALGSTATMAFNAPPSPYSPLSSQPRPTPVSRVWTCQMCTFENQAGSLACEVCAFVRPSSSPAANLSSPKLSHSTSGTLNSPISKSPSSFEMSHSLYSAHNPSLGHSSSSYFGAPDMAARTSYRAPAQAVPPGYSSPNQPYPTQPSRWDCSRCQFSNGGGDSVCSTCFTARPANSPMPVMQVQHQRQQERVWTCPMCRFANKETVASCASCWCSRPIDIAFTAPVTSVVTPASPVLKHQPLGQLPSGWEERIDPRINRSYFINHLRNITTWDDPRVAKASSFDAGPPAYEESIPSLLPSQGLVRSSSAAMTVPSVKKAWACSLCTAHNTADSTKCLVCDGPRLGIETAPVEEKATQVSKPAPAATPTNALTSMGTVDTWACGLCSYVNNLPKYQIKCEVCDGPRPLVQTQPSRDSESKLKIDGWECDWCCTANDTHVTHCQLCFSPKPGLKVAETPRAAISGPGALSTPNISRSLASWQCSRCCHTSEYVVCRVCGQQEPPKVTPLATPQTTAKPIATLTTASFSSGSWQCSFCDIINNAKKEKCRICSRSRAVAAVVEPVATPASDISNFDPFAATQNSPPAYSDPFDQLLDINLSQPPAYPPASTPILTSNASTSHNMSSLVVEPRRKYSDLPDSPRKHSVPVEPPRKYSNPAEPPRKYSNPPAEPPRKYSGSTEPSRMSSSSTEPPRKYSGSTEPPRKYSGSSEPPRISTGPTEPPRKYSGAAPPSPSTTRASSPASGISSAFTFTTPPAQLLAKILSSSKTTSTEPKLPATVSSPVAASMRVSATTPAANQPAENKPIPIVSPAVITASVPLEKSVEDLDQAAKIRAELFATEQTYVFNLTRLLSVFIRPINQRSKSFGLTQAQTVDLCGNILVIARLHTVLLQDMQKEDLVEVLLKNADYLKIYTSYVNNYEKMIATITLLNKNKNFEKFLLETEREQMSLPSFLIMPIQRIPRYCLLLRELQKSTSDEASNYSRLCLALEKLKAIAACINERKRQFENTSQLLDIQTRIRSPANYLVLKPGRWFVRQGKLKRMEDDLYYYFFLFNDALLQTTDKYKVVQEMNITTLTVQARSMDTVLFTILQQQHKGKMAEFNLLAEVGAERDAWVSDLQSAIGSNPALNLGVSQANIANPDEPYEVLLEGPLQKRSPKGVNRYQDRYFELLPTVLIYRKRKGAPDRAGEVRLRDVTATRTIERADKKGGEFEIDIRSVGDADLKKYGAFRTFTLLASSGAEAAQWLKAIQRQVEANAPATPEPEEVPPMLQSLGGTVAQLRSHADVLRSGWVMVKTTPTIAPAQKPSKKNVSPSFVKRYVVLTPGQCVCYVNIEDAHQGVDKGETVVNLAAKPTLIPLLPKIGVAKEECTWGLENGEHSLEFELILDEKHELPNLAPNHQYIPEPDLARRKEHWLYDFRVAIPTTLFGVSIETAAKRSGPESNIPAPIAVAIKWLDERGLDEQGLYRIPGSKTEVESLISRFDRGESVLIPDQYSGSNLASLVVQYLRRLPENLFTNQLAPIFQRAMGSEQQLSMLKLLLGKLPLAQFCTIRALVRHLGKVAEQSEVNEMTAQNLSICVYTSMAQVINALIVNCDYMFDQSEPGQAIIVDNEDAPPVFGLN